MKTIQYIAKFNQAGADSAYLIGIPTYPLMIASICELLL